ncbi:hypothetical protein HJC23_005976 [Cyclotella cryptica]|uniref:sn-1-specific diacylglycerol lipase n=1 Tax=Cyclotella cryptica TaxID=29204 RepID=A0ABD3NWI3_9STRA|eukprot:CCRYP_019276-RA/>CCRYP_019276-RA protein AED:0.00 eAED:0.00 QI:83/-1/1/1/-1/1/1/95/901
MPLPPAIPLFLLHPNPASTCAARAGASSLLAAALARDLWRRTPEWIREDDVWKSLLDDEGGGSGGHKDEMASLAAVIQKLQGLIVTGYETLGSERRSMRRRRTARGSRGASRVDSQRERVQRKSTSECLCQGNGALCQSCTFCQSQGQSTLDSSATTDRSLADPITPLEWHAALLAYIQLSNQIRERYPYWRDRMYEATICEFDAKQDECDMADADKCNLIDTNRAHNESHDQVDNRVFETICSAESSGLTRESNERIYHDSSTARQNNLHNVATKSPGIPITASEIKELKTMLDYAVWAYEPDEEILRNLLHADIHTDDSAESVPMEENCTDGYQLLVHRTTSYIDPLSEGNDTNKKPGGRSTNKVNSSKKLRKPPGRVGYFVAVSHSKKVLLIGMKGTSTLEEILTDCCGRAVRLELEHDPHHPSPSNCSTKCTYEDTLKVSLTPGENDSSQLEIIEVELVHYEESIQSSMTPAREFESHDAYYLHGPSKKNSGKSAEQEAPKGQNFSTNSSNLCPTPAENIVLLPSYESSEVRQEQNDDSDQKHQQSAVSSSLKKSVLFHEEVLENFGIEMQPERTTKLRGAHEGILHCAQQLFYEISPLIEEFAQSKGYDVVCTGHSLGAGTASLLALLIRGRYPELVVPRECGRDCGNDRITTERVRVYAFASPPVLDRASALACQHYVTSVVNNSDIIPRSSLTNLDVLLTMLEAVRARLLDLGMNPDGNNKSSPKESGNDFCQKPKNIFASLAALFHKLSEGTEGNLLMNALELQEVWDEAVADASLGEDGIYWSYEGDHHLLVPGKLLVMYEPWSLLGSRDKSYHNSREDQKHRSLSKIVNGETGANQNDRSNPVYRAIWTNGTAKMLKGFEVGAGGKIATDHLTCSYYRALASLEQDLSATL